MSNTKISLFLSLALAIMTGDDAKATAVKIQRTAIAVLTAQIAAKVLHTMMLEEKIIVAEENLKRARVFQGVLIDDHTKYVHELLVANLAVKAAKTALADHLEEVEFLQSELEVAKA